MNKIKQKKKIIGISITVVLIILLVYLVQFILIKKSILKIKKSKKIIVLMRNTPTIYYQGAEGPAGFEYELMSDFAEFLDVKLEVKTYNGISELLSAIVDKKGDIASGAITKTKERNDTLLFGPEYYNVSEVIVYKRGQKSPKHIDDLTNYSFMVTNNSSYIITLKELKNDHPQLEWEVLEELSTEQLLYKVFNNTLDCTVADKNIFDINRRYYPGIRVAFPIKEDQSLAWVINEDKRYIKKVLKYWLRKYKKSGDYNALVDKYYSYSKIFDFVDIRAFHRNVDRRLPRYKSTFRKVAKRYGFSWQLLAAQSYQESHWRPYAKSPTGVRGMMMLTRNTAKSLGVTNRMNIYQSINGGAKYLSKMLNQVPKNVDEKDRILFALAGYNVGMAHIKDAMILADELNIDKNRWNEFKTVLPLLTQEKYYKKLKYGYARGTEPVIYVKNILNYKNILENKK